jgi:hypothetical protein
MFYISTTSIRITFFQRHIQLPANNLPEAGEYAVFFFLQLRTWATKNIILLYWVEGK